MTGCDRCRLHGTHLDLDLSIRYSRLYDRGALRSMQTMAVRCGDDHTAGVLTDALALKDLKEPHP